MPPKKNGNASAEDSDGAAAAVTSLCHLIMSCDEFKADNAKLAPILGIAQAKNVPRRINSIVNPYGFEFKNGKVLQRAGQSQDEEYQAVAGSGGSVGGGNETGIESKKEKKAKSQGRASKKRKAASLDAEDGHET